MTPESQIRRSLLRNDAANRFPRKHNGRKNITAVSMQRRGKHNSIRIEELLGNGIFCWSRPEAI
jgi:hypothetical protein